ncbi:MAG: type IX secretion system sortase PorU [Bacteroidales bacterium]|nr:type IX secretion system sortase PorU [Bacteroidales bacterium]
MKKILIFNLLFFIILYTFGQNKILNRKINWETPKSISHYYQINQKNINKTDFLFFDDAHYHDQNTMYPYYFELLKLNSQVDIKIINIKFEKLTDKEQSIIKYGDQIPNNISYKIEINYKRKQAYLQFNLLPLRKNQFNGQLEKVISFDMELIPKNKPVSSILKSSNFNSESVLKNGNWSKIKINNDGIYKISYSELIDMGFANPENVKVFGNSSGMLPLLNSDPCQDDLEQNSIYFKKGEDNIFNEDDYILFYAKGPDKLQYDTTNNFYYLTKHQYSNSNYLFLTTDVGLLNTISKIDDPIGSVIESNNTFIDFIHHENELENLLESGQLWFGEHFDINTNFDFEFEFPNLVTDKNIRLRSALAARSSASTSFDITSNSKIINQEIAAVNLSNYNSTYAYRNIASGTFTISSDNFIININYNKSSASSEGWLDYITLNADRELSMNDDQLIFRYYNAESNSKIIEFKISTPNPLTKIWDVTNPNQAKDLNLSYNNGTITIKVNVSPGLNEFIAFNSENFLTTELIGNVENQNLHSVNHRDMLIITYPDFISQANEIANIHIQEGLSVEIVTPEQIFNEFSSGTPDATAFRNFVRMIYNRPSVSDTLKYLLFIGDGSYDHKSITANNINYILTYQSVNSLQPTVSFVTDDFFGLLDPTDNIENDNSGLVDIGIGRLPVKSTEEAQQMVEKIKSYLNPENKGNWINSLCFVGDDEDNNVHMRDADRLASFVDTTYQHFFINKLYLDAFPQESSAVDESYPEVNRLINDEVNNGILIFNYTGHGGEAGLAHERILSIDDINSWINTDKLTIFMTATCEFSRFDNHKYTSAGEQVLLNPKGGSIALFSTTRLVYSSPNYTLNRNFYNYVFEKDYKGNFLALGDIIRLAKNASGSNNNKRNFTLLGDPALKMPLPKFNIITDSLNHNSISNYTDTLKALSKVTIHGHIENASGINLTSYNGIVFPLVLDKKRTITTLGNDGGTTMDFKMQNNILYKGKASIINGKFEFSFVVPKDISYNFDNGKISYYASNSENEAKGYFDNFIIGGSNANADIDKIGPSVQIYMNDENFVSGGVTDENPILYALLTDSSGINTVGNGIGHDITAILDNNSNNTIILNDYYESDIDEFQKGKIEYLFSELENGDHNLKLKVWDVYNNSSEENLDFMVAESESLAIKNLFNYPNPFTDQTSFYFDHNRSNEDLEVLIQVFTISGKLVKTINTIINSNAFRSEPINWNGLDDFGDKLGRGVYIYQLKVRTVEGETVKKIEKLVVLK